MVTLIQCGDHVGLVARIAGVLAQRHLNIISMREYVDTQAARFFLRLVSDPCDDVGALTAELESILPSDAVVQVHTERQKGVALLVTKEYHCLADILVRNHFKTLGASVTCVIGNHDTLRDICDRFGLPFYLVSRVNKARDEFEAGIHQVLAKHESDYLVLAKFMQVLSSEFVARYRMRIVNIHHSFLPAFVGASPYQQAYRRGVKLIGATAHFVTNDLDEGPIIEQQIIPVNHSFSASDMVRAGKEVEKSVLAKALKMVLEDRVFVYSNKTVVFE